MRTRIALIAPGIAAALAAPCVAHAASTSGEVGLASQLVDRGMAITPPTPVLEGALSRDWPNGWSVGVSAGVDTRSGRVAEGLARVSRTWPLAGDWQMQTSLQYFHYAGLNRLNAWELDLGWSYRDILTFNLAGIDAPGSAQRLRPAADLNFRWPLPRHFSFSAGVGYTRYVIPIYVHSREYEVKAYYSYAQAGIVWSNGRWRVGVDRMLLDGAVRRRLGHLAASPWLATASWSF